MSVRFGIAALLLFSAGCGPGLVFNGTTDMPKDQMLARASHVFLGVIETHRFEPWLFFRMPGKDAGAAKYWMILRREVLVEAVLKGQESRKKIDVYEIYWTGGASGDWNSTENGERAVFLVRVENGRYHVVRDWRRSIFPVTTGPHTTLPLDDSHPLWERIALMNWSVEWRADAAVEYPHFRYADPGNALGLWRTIKLERGLVRHPSREVRVLACAELLGLGGWGQDECWDELSSADRAYLGERCQSCTMAGVAAGRQNLERLGARWFWARMTTRDERRVLTAVSNRERRREFCALYGVEYPGDTDYGCPADRPPPASIVTERGDVPFESAPPPARSPRSGGAPPRAGWFEPRCKVCWYW